MESSTKEGLTLVGGHQDKFGISSENPGQILKSTH